MPAPPLVPLIPPPPPEPPARPLALLPPAPPPTLVIELKTEFAPLEPVEAPPLAPAPPAPMVTVYDPAADAKVASAEPPPPVNSPIVLFR